MMDEMLRQVQKPIAGEKNAALGHADIHRVIKDMIKAEVAGKNEVLHFSKVIAGILLKDFESHVETRAVFIVIELLEHKETSPFLVKQVKAMLPSIQKTAKSQPKSVGLQLLVKKLSE